MSGDASPRAYTRIVRALEIVLLCVVAAILYGIAHDQVTARVCLEYFTVFHPKVVDSEDPTVLGLVWGVLATWWVGLALGLLLALAARAGRRPPRSATSLVRPVGRLLLVMAGSALVAGLLGWASIHHDVLMLSGDRRVRLEPHRYARYFGVWWAHMASYLVGALGGIALCVRTWKSRRVSIDAHQGPPHAV
jgi:hypothetical protein